MVSTQGVMALGCLVACVMRILSYLHQHLACQNSHDTSMIDQLGPSRHYPAGRYGARRAANADWILERKQNGPQELFCNRWFAPPHQRVRVTSSAVPP